MRVMQKSYRCAACHRSVLKTESYIVRIEVLADPGTPAIEPQAIEPETSSARTRRLPDGSIASNAR